MAHANRRWSVSLLVSATLLLSGMPIGSIVAAGVVGSPSVSLTSTSATATQVTYTAMFNASSSGGLTGGTDQINLTGPSGTVFAGLNACSPYVLTNVTTGATSACPPSITGAGTNAIALTLPTGFDVNSGDQVRVTANGVTNSSSTGSQGLSISTSADSAASAPFTLTPVTSVGTPERVVLSTTAAGATGVNYEVDFRSTNGMTPGFSTISLTAPAGTVFPSSTGCTPAYEIVDDDTGNGSNCITVSGGGTNSITLTLPPLQNRVFARDSVIVTIRGLTNSPTHGQMSLDVLTTSDPAVAHLPMTIGGADLFTTSSGPPTVQPGAQFTFTMSIGNAGPDATAATLTGLQYGSTSLVSVTQTSGGSAFTCVPSPGPIVDCHTQSLAVGASASFDMVLAVDPGTADGTVLNSRAGSQSYTDDPDSSNNLTGIVTRVVVPATPTRTGTPTSTPTATPTFTPTNTPTPTQTPGGTSTLGLTTVGSVQDEFDSNWMTGSRVVTGAQAASVTSISVYVGGIGAPPNNQYSVAIFTDSSGRPGALVGQSSTGTLTPNAWNTLSIGAVLNANTAYWLMYNANGTTGAVDNMFYSDDPSFVGAYAARAFGSWPGSFGGSTLARQRYSIYATFNGGSLATATSTSTPTNTPTLTPTPTSTNTLVATNTPTQTPTNTPTTGGVSWTRVQGTSESAVTTSGATVLTGVGSGHILLLAITTGDATTAIGTITDSAGTQFTLRAGQVANGLSTWLYSASSVAGGTHSVSVAFSGTVGHQIYLQEYATTGAIANDGAGAAATGSGTSPSPGGLTTSGGVDLVVGVQRYSASQSPGASPAAGYTARNPQARSVFMDRLNVGPGAQTASATIPTAAAWNAISWAFTAQ